LDAQKMQSDMALQQAKLAIDAQKQQRG
jgi:hypothetical protein